jgi:chorismate mutase
MGELEAAQRHLTEALRRLESALARRLSAGDGAGNGHSGSSEILSERNALAADVGELRHECERLQSALDEAMRDRDEVRHAADSVARRLDGSIEELDRMLGD